MPANRTMPDSTILPILSCRELTTSIEWLCKVFGFTERWRAGAHRAQLEYNGGVIVLSKQEQGQELSVSSLLVRVDNVDQHYDQVKQFGVQILQAPADYPYGERQYTAIDLNGHVWTFSQSVADLAPEDWGGTSYNKNHNQ